MHGLDSRHVERDSRVVSRRDEQSGIWAYTEPKQRCHWSVHVSPVGGVRISRPNVLVFEKLLKKYTENA